MKIHAFKLSNTSDLQAYIDIIASNYQVYLLREKWDEKVLDKYNGEKLDRNDKQGRLFSNNFELRYKMNSNYVKCTLLCEDDFLDILDIPNKKTLNITVQDEARTFYIQSLDGLIIDEEIFSSNKFAVKLRGFKFDDESEGYYLCGVN
jgi:hypothetical protein